MDSLRFLSSRAPKWRANRTPEPADKPVKKLTTMLEMSPLEVTAARAVVPTKWPTTTASTLLYSVWKICPSKMGMANFKSNGVMLPWVRSMVLRLMLMGVVPPFAALIAKTR